MELYVRNDDKIFKKRKFCHFWMRLSPQYGRRQALAAQPACDERRDHSTPTRLALRRAPGNGRPGGAADRFSRRPGGLTVPQSAP